MLKGISCRYEGTTLPFSSAYTDDGESDDEEVEGEVPVADRSDSEDSQTPEQILAAPQPLPADVTTVTDEKIVRLNILPRAINRGRLQQAVAFILGKAWLLLSFPVTLPFEAFRETSF